jgi:protein-ribulosamine 3-kinase
MSLNGLPEEIVESIKSNLKQTVIDFSFKSHSSFSQTGKITTSKGSYFIKWNDVGDSNHRMFDFERKGLDLLKSVHAVRVPNVEYTSTINDSQFIVMEWIEPAKKSEMYWEDLGRQLAAQHRYTHEFFGLEYDNVIGEISQCNAQHKAWIPFFINYRLCLADRFDLAFRKRMNQFIDKLPGIIPVEKPSLLHGDLWSGNVLTDSNGQSCLIDPAVYYGHREVDIAFTRLFGGFPPSFYGAYNEAFPLAPGHEQRTEIFNLYPLLVHATMFNDSYLSQADGIIRRWI